jgi:hypothetical protein
MIFGVWFIFAIFFSLYLEGILYHFMAKVI